MLENDYKLSARTTLTERLVRRKLTNRDWGLGENMLLLVAHKYYKRVSLRSFGDFYYKYYKHMMWSIEKYIKDYYKDND